MEGVYYVLITTADAFALWNSQRQSVFTASISSFMVPANGSMAAQKEFGTKLGATDAPYNATSCICYLDFVCNGRIFPSTVIAFAGLNVA